MRIKKLEFLHFLEIRESYFVSYKPFLIKNTCNKHAVLASKVYFVDCWRDELAADLDRSVSLTKRLGLRIPGLHNLVPRVFLCHTLIAKPNEHPGTLRSNAPRIWVHYQPSRISLFARQRESTENGRCSRANSAEDKSRN